MRRALTSATIVAVALLTLAACGGGGGSGSGNAASPDTGTSSGTAAPANTRPPATQAAGPKGVDPTALLARQPKAADIRPLKLGIPTVAAIGSMGTEVAIDPTGPCGAALTPPPLDAAAGRTYTTVKGEIIGVALPRDATVDAYIAGNSGDLTAGCPSHTTTDANGAELTLSAPETVDISATTADGVAWISTIEGADPPRSRITLLLPTDDAAALVTMVTPEAVDAAFVQQMADIWYTKLAA
jgi:hypothetical protein